MKSTKKTNEKKTEEKISIFKRIINWLKSLTILKAIELFFTIIGIVFSAIQTYKLLTDTDTKRSRIVLENLYSLAEKSSDEYKVLSYTSQLSDSLQGTEDVKMIKTIMNRCQFVNEQAKIIFTKQDFTDFDNNTILGYYQNIIIYSLNNQDLLKDFFELYTKYQNNIVLDNFTINQLSSSIKNYISLLESTHNEISSVLSHSSANNKSKDEAIKLLVKMLGSDDFSKYNNLFQDFRNDILKACSQIIIFLNIKNQTDVDS